MNQHPESVAVTGMILIHVYSIDGVVHTDLSRFNSFEFDSPVNQGACGCEALKSRYGDSLRLHSCIICGLT